MKRALIVSTVSRQFYLFEQINIEILRELGYEVHGAADFSDQNERLDSVYIIRHQIDFHRSPFSIKNIIAYRQLKSLMKKYAFDLVHCHSPVGGVLARLAARSVGNKRVIYTAHGFHFYKGAPLLKWLLIYPIERWLSKYTDILITINREDYKRAQSFKAGRVEYVPGIGIDTEGLNNYTIDRRAIRAEMGIADDDIVIISVGELSKRKNHEVIIKALAALWACDFKYILCGTGALEERLKSLVAKYGLDNKVVFAGFRNDIPKLLSIADIFALPSYMEGLSVALMEAMACGLPVVCSRIRGNTDILKNNRGGFLADPNDVNGFKNALERLIADKDLRERFGEFNKDRIRKHDRKFVKEKMKEIYISVDKDSDKSPDKSSYKGSDKSKGKRIAFIIGSMRCGGAERVISILANEYSDSGWQVDILLLLDMQCEYKLRDDIRLINICNESRPRTLYLPIWIFSIRKYIKEAKPDKVVSFIGRINVLTLIAGLGLGRDIIISERNNPKRDGRSFIVKLATYITYPLAKGIIFQTEASRSCFPAYIRDKSVIIPNPVNVRAMVSAEKSKKIVTAGRLSREKNHKMLINAFHKLKAKHPDYCLYIYGEGILRTKLERQIEELGLTTSVFLPGSVNDLHEKIADAEIFVLCSDYEGMSNALVEAMMMGLPCISTRYDGVTELIRDGINGLLVRPGDDEQLYRKLNILIKNKEKALYMGLQGQRSVEHMKLINCIPVWRSFIEG